MSSPGKLLAFAVLLGLDSFRASAAMASTGIVGKESMRLAFAFGLCDAAALLAGLTAGYAAPDPIKGALHAVGPIVLGALVLYGVVVSRRPSPPRMRGRWLIIGGIPFSLSVDNLAGGVTLGVNGLPVLASSIVIGVASAMLSLAGVAAGRVVERWFASGIGLVGAALLLLIVTSLAIDPR